MKKKASIPHLDVTVEHHQYLEGIEKRIKKLEEASDTVAVEGLDITLASGDRLTFKNDGDRFPFKITTVRGVFGFGGNEAAIISTIDDPPKIRLGSVGNQLGAVSYNWCHPSTPLQSQYEQILVSGLLTEDNPDDMGGQLQIDTQRPRLAGDAGMVKMFIIGSAYTTDGVALVRQRTTVLTDITPFAGGYPAASSSWVSPYLPPTST